MDSECKEGLVKVKVKVQCKRNYKTKINIDCIKVCPMNKSVWAISFYQQQPQFVGGVQILSTSQLQQKEELGSGSQYLQLGPVMHIQWLDTSKQNEHKINNKKLGYLLAAHRCDQAIVLSYSRDCKKLQICSRIVLQANIFCLYCDWKLVSANSQSISCTAIVSSNESSVFCFTLQIDQIEIQKQQGQMHQIKQKSTKGSCKVGQIEQYSKHEYAVWACKLSPTSNPSLNYMVVGDEVSCLYLYDTDKKQLVATNKKAHDQGICQLIWKDPQTLMVGSFDGSISQIAILNFAQVLKKYEIGGTIWRIIPLNFNNKPKSIYYLICNSSDKQFQIYDTQQSKVIWNSQQQHHSSLAYSADFNGQTMVTASFYDQAVSVWTCSIN